MKTATWNGTVLAQSDATVVIVGNQYFPPESINKQYFKSSDTQTTCPWKGLASYHDIEVDGKLNRDAAWYYEHPSNLAASIKGHVAFGNGVVIK